MHIGTLDQTHVDDKHPYLFKPPLPKVRPGSWGAIAYETKQGLDKTYGAAIRNKEMEPDWRGHRYLEAIDPQHHAAYLITKLTLGHLMYLDLDNGRRQFADTHEHINTMCLGGGDSQWGG